MNNCPRVQTRTGFDVGEPQVQTPVRALASAAVRALRKQRRQAPKSDAFSLEMRALRKRCGGLWGLECRNARKTRGS